MGPHSVSLYDPSSLEGLRRNLRLDPFVIRRFLGSYLRKAHSLEESLQVIPEESRMAFSGALAPAPLSIVDRRDSELDGATKLLLEGPEGSVETVILRILSGRSSVCVSVATGCPEGCAFCATGRLGAGRGLPASSILEQVRLARRLLAGEGRELRNIVFMGMGEPLRHEEALHGALKVLEDPTGFGLHAGNLMVSTVGLPEPMVRLARSFPGVGLALSLHAARQEVRERLIPATRRHPLPELREALLETQKYRKGWAMVEYLTLSGLTDTQEDLDALESFLAPPLNVRVNLIPFNPFPGVPDGLAPSSSVRVAEFAAELKSRGFTVTIRRSLGADIGAACGQLARGKRHS